VLTQQQVGEIRRMWDDTTTGVPFYVVRKDGEFLCEGPYDRWDLLPEDVDEETEACIRLFPSRIAAQRYCDNWRRLLGDEPNDATEHKLNVMTADVQTIWKYLGAIVANSYAEHQQPPRIDVCYLSPLDTPIVIDCLFSEQAELN
jgi:hypothetical protein